MILRLQQTDRLGLLVTLGAPGAIDVSTDRSKDTGRNWLRTLAAMLPVTAASDVRRLPGWVPCLAAFLFAAVVTFAGALALAGHQAFIIPVIRGTPRTPPLQIGVAPDVGAVRLSWNPAAAQKGTPAVLQIIDGGKSATQILDFSQVTAGSFLYKPVSGDVTFHLSVRGSDGPVDASLQMPEELANQVVSSQPSAQRRTRPGLDEAAAYDETPHPRRKTSSNEAAAFDPKKAEATSSRVHGQNF